MILKFNACVNINSQWLSFNKLIDYYQKDNPYQIHYDCSSSYFLIMLMNFIYEGEWSII